MARSSLSLSLAGRAALLGTVTGMRSQLPLALLALEANRGGFARRAGSPLGLLRSRKALIGFGLSAVGELVVDKLPMAPSRLAAGSLAGRLAIGALVAAALAAGTRGAIPAAAGLGAAGAGLGSYAGYHARAALGRTTGIPDPVWAVAEDALAISLGLAAIRSGRR